jgi:hypothetical protein
MPATQRPEGPGSGKVNDHRAESVTSERKGKVAIERRDSEQLNAEVYCQEIAQSVLTV